MKKVCSSIALLFVILLGYSQYNYELTDRYTKKTSQTNVVNGNKSSETIAENFPAGEMAKTRNLTSDEKDILSQVFVKTLPLDKILIADDLGLDGKMYTTSFLTSNYRIHAGDHFYKNGFSTSDHAHWLVHEAAHVWQGVHGVFKWDYIMNSLVCQALTPGSDADYNYKPGKSWSSYNAEEQATIVEDWYYKGMSETDPLWTYIVGNIREPGFGGQVYFFNQSQYLRWTIDKGVDDGYPKSTTDHWNSFVKSADAGFSRIVGEKEFFYFFKGNEYLKWKADSGPVDGYPKKIADEWNSDFIKNGINAALNIDNNTVYFFKGDEYIKYTFGEGQKGSAKKISAFFNSSFIKDGFDACCYWGNGKAYFFKGDQYIRYTVGEGADSGYPKNTASVFNSWMNYGIKFILLKRKDCF
jgi:matrix metalloproteinase-14 (membrane-inserted)